MKNHITSYIKKRLAGRRFTPRAEFEGQESNTEKFTVVDSLFSVTI